MGMVTVAAWLLRRVPGACASLCSSAIAPSASSGRGSKSARRPSLRQARLVSAALSLKAEARSAALLRLDARVKAYSSARGTQLSAGSRLHSLMGGEWSAAVARLADRRLPSFRDCPASDGNRPGTSCREFDQGAGQGITATPQGKRPTGTDFSAFKRRDVDDRHVVG